MYLFHTCCTITINGKGYFPDNTELLVFVQERLSVLLNPLRVAEVILLLLPASRNWKNKSALSARCSPCTGLWCPHRHPALLGCRVWSRASLWGEQDTMLTLESFRPVDAVCCLCTSGFAVEEQSDSWNMTVWLASVPFWFHGTRLPHGNTKGLEAAEGL